MILQYRQWNNKKQGQEAIKLKGTKIIFLAAMAGRQKIEFNATLASAAEISKQAVRMNRLV